VRSDPEGVIVGFYQAWLLRDVAAAMAYCHPDIRFAQHFTDPELPFTGETIGVKALEARVNQVFTEWVFLDGKLLNLDVDGESARSQCPFRARHIATGEVFDGTFRYRWMVRNGQITEIDEFTDIARLKAFLQLLKGPIR
jgi:ketosteroid isomerase-like protein